MSDCNLTDGYGDCRDCVQCEREVVRLKAELDALEEELRVTEEIQKSLLRRIALLESELKGGE